MSFIKTGLKAAGKVVVGVVGEIAKNAIKDEVNELIEDEIKTKKVNKTPKRTEPKKKVASEKAKNKNLVKCRDCGEYISIHAEACPFCGCPASINKAKKEKPAPEKKPEKQVQKKETKKYPEEIAFVKNKKDTITTLAMFGGLLVFFGIPFLGIYFSSSERSLGNLITSIVIMSIGIILLIIMIPICFIKVKSFYFNNYRIDIKISFRYAIRVNNVVIYRGRDNYYQFQLDDGNFYVAKFDKNNSMVSKLN